MKILGLLVAIQLIAGSAAQDSNANHQFDPKYQRFKQKYQEMQEEGAVVRLGKQIKAAKKELDWIKARDANFQPPYGRRDQQHHSHVEKRDPEAQIDLTAGMLAGGLMFPHGQNDELSRRGSQDDFLDSSLDDEGLDVPDGRGRDQEDFLHDTFGDQYQRRSNQQAQGKDQADFLDDTFAGPGRDQGDFLDDSAAPQRRANQHAQGKDQSDFLDDTLIGSPGRDQDDFLNENHRRARLEEVKQALGARKLKGDQEEFLDQSQSGYKPGTGFACYSLYRAITDSTDSIQKRNIEAFCKRLAEAEPGKELPETCKLAGIPGGVAEPRHLREKIMDAEHQARRNLMRADIIAKREENGYACLRLFDSIVKIHRDMLRQQGGHSGEALMDDSFLEHYGDPGQHQKRWQPGYSAITLLDDIIKIHRNSLRQQGGRTGMDDWILQHFAPPGQSLQEKRGLPGYSAITLLDDIIKIHRDSMQQHGGRTGMDDWVLQHFAPPGGAQFEKRGQPGYSAITLLDDIIRIHRDSLRQRGGSTGMDDWILQHFAPPGQNHQEKREEQGYACMHLMAAIVRAHRDILNAQGGHAGESLIDDMILGHGNFKREEEGEESGHSFMDLVGAIYDYNSPQSGSSWLHDKREQIAGALGRAWSKIKRYYDIDEEEEEEDSNDPFNKRSQFYQQVDNEGTQQQEGVQFRRRGLGKDSKMPDGVIKSTRQRKLLGPEARTALSKRRLNNIVNTTLENVIDFYALPAQIGTPPQKVDVLIDTGSSDMWVYAPHKAGDPSIRTFDPAHSRTWHDNHSDFHIRYVSGAASGTWGTDTVNIGGAPLREQSLAVVVSGKTLPGVPGLVGVGLSALESTFSKYSNVPLSLFYQHYIKTPTYSLYLDRVGSDTGSVLFGGIDHAKYKPPLTVVRRASSRNFNAIVHIGSTQVSFGRISATLDSGTSLGLLPNKMLKSIAAFWNLQFDPHIRLYYIDKNAKPSKIPLVFTFSGSRFLLYPDQLLIDADKLGDIYGSHRRILGFASSEENARSVILGDVFLRNFYVVYDLINPQIGIAEASYDDTHENIEAISSAVFPKANLAPNYGETASVGLGLMDGLSNLRDRLGSIIGNLGSSLGNLGSTIGNLFHHNAPPQHQLQPQGAKAPGAAPGAGAGGAGSPGADDGPDDGADGGGDDGPDNTGPNTDTAGAAAAASGAAQQPTGTTNTGTDTDTADAETVTQQSTSAAGLYRRSVQVPGGGNDDGEAVMVGSGEDQFPDINSDGDIAATLDNFLPGEEDDMEAIEDPALAEAVASQLFSQQETAQQAQAQAQSDARPL